MSDSGFQNRIADRIPPTGKVGGFGGFVLATSRSAWPGGVVNQLAPDTSGVMAFRVASEVDSLKRLARVLSDESLLRYW